MGTKSILVNRKIMFLWCNNDYQSPFLAIYKFTRKSRTVSPVSQRKHFELKQQKLCVGFLLTNRQFQEVGHCRRHIFGPILPKFYVEFENATSSCDNLRSCCN